LYRRKEAGEEFEQSFKRLGKHVKTANSENNLCVTKVYITTGKYK